jgi:hypothetical protein
MEHDADEAVSIEVIGAVMGSMVKKFRAGLEFRTEFFHQGIINGKKDRGILEGRRDTAKGKPGGDSRPLKMVKRSIIQSMIKGVQGLAGELGNDMYPSKTNGTEGIQSTASMETASRNRFSAVGKEAS